MEWDENSPLLLKPASEALPLAHHRAPGADGAATLEELASQARGQKRWGILRADVDQFSARLRKAQTIEEHLQFSVFFRQFLSGEVQVLCSQGEFWQKVTVLYSGGDEFAVVGAWDALIPFAREMERLFSISVNEFLKEFPGPEGKTLSMAIAIAPSADTPVQAVYAEAGRLLELAKNSAKDSIHVFGRTLDWHQLGAASDLKNIMVRLVDEFGCSPQFLDELRASYRETDRVLPSRASRQRAGRQDRPWRFHRRLTRVLEGPSRQRDFQKVRATLLSEFIQRNQSQVKLKPSGRVALEWARLAQES
jgi:CRISPR-associated protein Csm1